MSQAHISKKIAELQKHTGKIEKISLTSLDPAVSFIDLAARFAKNPGTVALLSGGDLDCARYHILAIEPWMEIKAYGKDIHITADGTTFRLQGDPFDILRQVMDAYAIPFNDFYLPVAAGLFGYFSYDLKDFIEKLPRTSILDQPLPCLCLSAPSFIIVHDKEENHTYLCATERTDGTGKKMGAPSDMAAAMAASFLENSGFSGGTEGLTSSFTQPEYLAAVKSIKDYIVSGDIYQVNLSQRFETDFSGDPFALFSRLYQTAPGPFYAYIHAGDHWIVSTSPERFLQRRKNHVETRPIKGTRPRGKNPAEDLKFRKDLVRSAKDDAELSMIVDLMRNDLGRVCRGGSVGVTDHKRLESYPNVFHLVSIVEGELADGRDSVDLLRATFPGGSITGCPRIRAMEIIDELEPVRRHVYTGSIGYISFHDTLDLSIAIRTATIYRNRVFFSVGGGVVYDSDPTDEFEETLHKARSLMGALQPENAKKITSPKTRIWQNGRLVSPENAVIPVSDLGFQYGLGFFETIRVDNDRPLFLDEHINRFYRAWKALFDTPPPDLTWDEIIRQVVMANHLENDIAAVKIMASYGAADSPLAHHCPNLVVLAKKYAPRPALTRKTGLDVLTYPHARQTPLADHKTLNYAYYHLAGQWAQKKGADEALILNPDGSVSETNTANILLISGSTACQPASPHVLAGVMEKKVIQYLKRQGYAIETRNIRPKDLLSADTVLLTNSLIGAVPALNLDGNAIKPDARFCQRINAALFGK
jgi:para-aminobenzoate synthetase component 1